MTTVTGPYPTEQYAAPRAAKGVRVELDRPRRLYYNMQAWRRLYREASINIFDLLAEPDGLERAWKNPDTMTLIAWAGLLHDDPALTPDDVGEMIDFDNMTALAEAFALAMDRQNRGEIDADPTKATPSAGDGSTS